MANLVNISLKVVNRQGTAQSGLVSYLYNKNYSDPFSAGIPTSVVASGTTSGGGDVLFTGITPGTYDIAVTTPSGVSYLRNYVVKNEYVVPIGTTSYDFQNSSYVMSSGDISGAGILTQNHVVTTGIKVANGSISQGWTLPFPISGSQIFYATGTYAKATGNSYYHDIATTVFTQRVRMQVV